MPEDLEGKSLASLVSNNKDAKSPCDYLNLLPRSLQDPGVFSAGRTVHTWLCAYIHKNACIPMASNTSLSQQVEGIGTVAKSTTKLRYSQRRTAFSKGCFQGCPPSRSESGQSETAGTMPSNHL